jgi:hypothetical protein
MKAAAWHGGFDLPTSWEELWLAIHEENLQVLRYGSILAQLALEPRRRQIAAVAGSSKAVRVKTKEVAK